MEAEVDALCGASHGERHPERVNRRNGYRERAWDTRSGTIDLALPKLREGSYFPGWLLTPRKRSEQALVATTSDAHQGLTGAIAATLPGASWQRCRTHFMRNLLTRVPKSAQPFVATLVRSIFAQPDAASVREQQGRVVVQLEERFAAAAALLEEAGPDILAFTAVPKEVWRQVWSNNPLERLNREIRRRTDVVGIFPNRGAVVRLVGAVLAEQNDEWADTGRRYMSLEVIAKTLAPPSPEATMEVAMIAA
jgi:transposase-like protein